LLGERQKHIGLADQSENGWDMVTEYICHNFAVDKPTTQKWTDQQELRKDAKLQLLKNIRGFMGSPSSLAIVKISMRMTWAIIKITMQASVWGYNCQNQFYRPNLERQQHKRPHGPCYQCSKMGHNWAECLSQPDKYPIL